MSKELKTGQKISIDGRQFQIISLDDSTYWSKRKTVMILQAIEEESPEDVKPSPAIVAFQRDIDRMNRQFEPFLKSFAEGLERWAGQLQKDSRPAAKRQA